MDSKFIKTLGDLKMNDEFKFIFNEEVSDRIYQVTQIGNGESGCSAISGNPDRGLWHHNAKVFQVHKKQHYE